MAYVRVFPIRHWDPTRKKLVDFAFKPSSDGSGVSVFDSECAAQRSGSICQHIHTYYAAIAGHPAFFWAFDTQELPDGCSVLSDAELIDRGLIARAEPDPCHSGVLISKNHGKKFAADKAARVQVCQEDGPRAASPEFLTSERARQEGTGE